MNGRAVAGKTSALQECVPIMYCLNMGRDQATGLCGAILARPVVGLFIQKHPKKFKKSYVPLSQYAQIDKFIINNCFAFLT